jgi:soluble lytic murein transglycosylase
MLGRTLLIVGLACCAGNGSSGSAETGVAAAEPAAPKAAPRPPTPATPTARGPSALTTDMATPYFRDGVAGEAAALFALEKWSEARAKFKAAMARAPADLAPRIRLMIAFADSELDNHGAAAPGFERAAREIPVIADILNFQAARSRYYAKNLDASLRLARLVPAGSISGMDAKLLIGDILRARSAWAEVAEHYRAYLRDHPAGIRLPEARFRLAEALGKTRGDAAEIRELLTKVMTSAPLSRWGNLAEAAVGAVKLDAAGLIERGMVYYNNHRNSESEADFTAALSAPGLDRESRCVAAYHRANSVYKQRDRSRAAPLFDEAIKACDKSQNVDLQVKSAYQAGRSYGLTSRSETAIKRYALVENKHPNHSYADDARLRQAEEYRDLNDQTQVTRLLSSIPTRYPTGDMRAEAMWRLGWRAYKDGKHAEAIAWLKKQIATKPIDDNYWAEGQAQYWIGRSHDKLGERAKSLAAYQSAIELYPMGYYALLSLNRIREVDPARFAAITKKIAAEPAGHDPKAAPFHFVDRPEFKKPEFAGALELLRLGLGSQAQRQLALIGFTIPSGKDALTSADQIDKTWAIAFLYDRAGRYPFSHWVTRWHVLDYKRQWPVGHNKARWRIGYPTAWWSLLDKNARKHGYPTELQIAFVREESAFDPLQESWANAIGLTQMIRSTARRFAKGTGIKVSRETLRDPVKNVTIGARFLKFLFGRFGGRVALVVPSYNAGEGATDRWLRYRGDWAMDEWSEEIPYDETRRYSKRVLSTYFTYSYLKDGAIPVMPNDIPPDAVARAKKRGN